MAELCMTAAATVFSRRWKATKPVENNIDEALRSIRTGDIDNPEVYSKICKNLGSSIESAIVMNAIPSSSYLHQLLLIVKEVYRRKTKFHEPWLMLLMLPMKDACQIGWFLDGDKDDLLNLMMENEVRYGFSDIYQSNAHSRVSDIVSRFYPTMKVENILTSLDVKDGYGTFVAEFNISLDTLPTQCQNLYLLVARVDNMDTSACIIRPSNVNFLLNDYKVPNFTKNYTDREPQLPSNVTKMMKDGVNRLLVCGDFNANSGQYIIAIAFMNIIPYPDPPQLQDYVNFVSVGDDSDCEIIEMESHISLSCPISQLRIETPVKGHLCKHPQCFDYSYFMEINAIRPTWKCPICNQPVCNLDIRIDHDFHKILNEVAKGVSDVIISPDGSWMVDLEEKSHSQSTKSKRKTKTRNTYVPDINITEAIDSLPNSSSASLNYVSTTPAVSPPPRVFRDSRLQSKSSNDMVHQTENHMNRVNLTTPPTNPLTKPNHPSAETQPHRTLQPNPDTSSTKKTRSTPLFTPVEQTKDHTNRVNLTTTPPPNPLTKPNHPSAETQPHRTPQPNPDTSSTKKARSKMTFTPVELTPCTRGSTNYIESISDRLKRRGQRINFAPGPSHPTPVPAPAPAPSSNTRQLTPTEIPKPNGKMPFGIMRGSLKGTELEAARLQFLQTRQPIRANQPWSMPTLTHLPELLMQQQQPSTDSENVSNLGN